MIHATQFSVVPAESVIQLEAVRELLLEYWRSRGLGLPVFDFDDELAGLPGKYVPPFGRLLLASSDSEIAGCVAIRKLEPEICEMKRLYVRGKFRRLGLGRILANSIITEARRMRYRKIRLDTIGPSMREAVALYDSLGFREIAPYWNNPLEGARYMELEL
jgi:putative acetyltransferase